MLLVDHQIRHLCLRTGANPEPMIEPFAEATSGGGIISYGLTHAGYDLRLGLTVYCMKSTFGEVLDPKRFKDPAYAASVMDRREYQPGDRVIIPANGYLLGHSLEYLRIPRHLKGRCTGKSSLARCAVSINTTPVEPAWKGHLTIEIANDGPLPVAVYAGEGIAQLEFELLAAHCETDYAEKGGQYQGQTGVTMARVRE